jgi:hypothetical protein
MSPVLSATTAVLLAAATAAVLSLEARIRYVRRLPSFRCRLGPPARRWPRSRARWCLRRTRAAWVGDVLLVRSGLLRLWITPLAVAVPPDEVVRALEPAEVRGFGTRPVALRFTAPDGRPLEIAVAHWDVDRLVGPFLAASLSGLPPAPREHGA